MPRETRAALRFLAAELRALAAVLDGLAGERDETLAALARRKLRELGVRP